jgi:hypothetical protein
MVVPRSRWVDRHGVASACHANLMLGIVVGEKGLPDLEIFQNQKQQ